MLKLFRYTFCRIYFFYRDVLHVRTKIHFYTSFVLGLLIFANVFVLLNIFTLLFSGQASFDYTSPYYILIGNGLVFSILIMASVKQRYVEVLKELQTLPNHDRKRLAVISNAYIVLSILALLPFILI
jgi:hypothetical protein